MRCALLPWHKRVCLLQRGGVQLKQRGDVVPVSHRHQLVLDPLAVGALVAAAAVRLQGTPESRSSVEEAEEKDRKCSVEGGGGRNSPQAVARRCLLYIQGSPATTKTT